MNKETPDQNQKVAYMHELLQKDIFSNPVRSVQEDIRNDLIDFKATLLKNLTELDSYLVRAKVIIGKL